MLDLIIQKSLQNRFFVVIAAGLLIVIGAYTVFNIPIDVLPDLTSPTVTIMTEAHGMATEEIESMVTFPIETAVNGATGVRRVRSSSAMGLSIIWVDFDWGMDIYRARQIVNEKIQLVTAQLPGGVANPVLAPISSVMGEIMLIGLTSDIHSPLELRTTVDWEIRKRLLAVNGVSQVIPIGGLKKQYQVLIDPNKLIAFKIGIDEIREALQKSNLNSSGGVFREKGNEFSIRGLGRIYSIEDLENTLIKVDRDIPILVKDIATVQIGPATKYGDASVNGRYAVVMAVLRQPDANTLELTERIEQSLHTIQESLPEGMIVDSAFFRQSEFINRAIDNVLSAMRDGAILVIIILFLFLGNVRTTFISLTALPLSLIFSIFILKASGITINTMTLGGMAIAIGALVDDAIIDVENVFRRLKENADMPDQSKKPVNLVIFEASREIRSSIVSATLIVIVVFLPLFFLTGMEGRLLQPLGVAYVASISASLVVALTVTPALCSYLLPRSRLLQRGDNRFLRALKGGYARLLDVSLMKPGWVIVGVTMILLLSITLLPFFGREFLPRFNEGSLNITVFTMPGTALEESDRIGLMAENIILGHPAILSTARRTGRDELDEHAMGVNSTEIEARFRQETASRDQMFEELRTALSVLPGTNVNIGQPLTHRIDHMLTGTRASIVIKVFGEDLYRIRVLGEEVHREMQQVDGIVDLSLEQQLDVPQIRIKPNRLAMARYGMTIEDLSHSIDVAFKGEVISQILEGQKSFDLQLRFDEKNRGSIDQITNTIFRTPAGMNVPLNQLAEISSQKGSNIISRENVQRKIIVQANIEDRDLRSVINEIQQRIESNVAFPPGYYVEYGGQFENEQRATRIISLLSIAAITLIFLILYLEFHSLKTALLVMINLPLALIGGIFSVYFVDGIISVASLIGFITLFGIASRNGILLVSHYQTLLNEGKAFFTVVRQGAIERLSPVLMTALGTGLALIPLVLGAGEPGKEIEAPMAIVILGGLVSSTFLNMIVLPVLYLKFGKPK